MRTLLLLLVSLPGFSQMPPAPGSPYCMNNCGAYTGDCTACHIVQGPAVYFAEFTSICQDCPNVASVIRPQVPMRYDPVKTLLAWVDTLQGKQDPRYIRIKTMTPERHVQLMQRAVRLKLDGATLGACSHAFRPGTLAKLPAEIYLTQKKLTAFYALR